MRQRRSNGKPLCDSIFVNSFEIGKRAFRDNAAKSWLHGKGLEQDRGAERLAHGEDVARTLSGDEPVYPTSDIAGFEHTIGDHFASTLAMAPAVRHQDFVVVVDEQTRQGRSPAAGIADSVQGDDAISVVDFGREQPGFEHGAVASIYLNRPPLCNARRRRSGRLPGDAKRGFAEYGAAGETQKQNGGHGADHAQRPVSSHRHYKTYGFVATYVQAAQRPV